MKWWDQMPWSSFFWMLGFKPVFSLFSFTFIKRLFSSSLLSAIRVVSSVYLRSLIFLPAMLIPVCASSIPAFCMMYSVYKLNKQGDNVQPWRTPFPIWNQSIVPCLFLTCLLTGIQVSQEAGKVVWYSHLFKNIPQCVVIHTVKGFSVVHEAEVDVFLEFSCLFYDPSHVTIWSLVPLPFLNPSYTSGSSPFMYCWNLIWKILSITSLVCERSTMTQ